MIKAEDIRSFINKKDTICDRFSCSECPVGAGNSRRCTLKYITQDQVDVIMNWKPPVDWSKVVPDTKVIVWENPERKQKRYFAKYQDGHIYAYGYGGTSWSTEPDFITCWSHGELAENDE